MKDNRTILPFRQSEKIDDPLTEIAREGARRMLAEALVAEADGCLVDPAALFFCLGKDLSQSRPKSQSSITYRKFRWGLQATGL